MKCSLVEVLSKLNKSSLEAVDDESAFDEFKQYMHIENRPVERDLRLVIEETNRLNIKKLILVCGNVGDGKSHLISVLKNSEEKLLENFLIHNDATASILPHLTPEQTLQRVLQEFDDDHIDNRSKVKIILAINLGTLSKFLDSAEEFHFIKLKQYVETKNILSQVLSEADDEVSQSAFSYVNFSDYHLYHLAEDGVYSPYMRMILERIFQRKKVKEIVNPFFAAWQGCRTCQYSRFCPVRMNYELLQDKQAQKGLEQIVLEAVIKRKLLISTRALLDFLYDIMVPNSFVPREVSNPETGEQAERLLRASLPMMLYESVEESTLLEAVAFCDRVWQGGRWLDEQAAQFHIAERAGDFLKDLSVSSGWVKLLFNLEDNIKRKLLFQFFVRFGMLIGQEQMYQETNQVYKEYLNSFYLVETGRSIELKDLYEKVKNAIYQWSGSEETDKLGVGSKGRKYMILGKIELKADINHLQVRKEKELEKFSPCIQLGFKKENNDTGRRLPIDFDLYEMILRIQQGYEPCIQDDSDYVSFVTFIREIAQQTDTRKEILIRENQSGDLYRLSEGDFGKLKFRRQ